MHVPFPALTGLLLRWYDMEVTPNIPDTFLDGSAPLLRHLHMDSIPFPGIAKLLPSCTHLVDLRLSGIPLSGYISPEAMITCLSGLTNLHILSLEFSVQSSLSRPDSESRPMTRSVLPNLTSFWFQGSSEYLEDLIAWIDAPRLGYLDIGFDQMNFNTSHLVQFISRTPTFAEPNEACVGCNFNSSAVVRLESSRFCVEILSEWSRHHLRSVRQICAKCLPPLHTVESLRLGVFRLFTEDYYSEYSEYGRNPTGDQWLGLLRPFTAVKNNLYISEEFQPSIARALQELVGGRTMEVLPSLQNVFLTKCELFGSSQETIGPFVAARQLSGHPIAVLPYVVEW